MRSIGLLLFNIGISAYFQDDYTAARAALEESLQISQKLGDQWSLARVLWGLGSVACAVGENAAAHAAFDQALAINRELHSHWEVCQVLEFAGFLAAEEAQPARAVRLFAAATALRDNLHLYQVPVVLARYQHYRAALLDTLGAADFEAAWKAGEAMTVEEAIAAASVSKT